MHSHDRMSAITLVALLTTAGLASLVALATPATAQCPTVATPLAMSRLDWYDLDQNGHLDAVLVALTHPIDAATVVPNDFVVPALDDSGRRATAIEIGDAASGSATVREFWLFFRESSALDAGWAQASAAPALTYSPPDGFVRVRPVNTGPCPTASSQVPTPTAFTNATRPGIDRAAPFLMAGYATQGASSILAVFSEPVSKDGGTTCTGTPPAGASCLAPADLCFEDASGTVRPIYAVAPVGGTYPSRAFTLSLSKSVASASTTAASTTVTTPGPTATFLTGPNGDVGRTITGTGIPAGTTIASVADGNTITLSQPATATGTVTVTVATVLSAADVAVQNLASGGDAPARVYGGTCAARTTPTFRDRAVDPDGTGPLAASSNAGVAASALPLSAGGVAVGAPYPVRVHASASDNRVVVEYNGPVTNSADAAVTGGYSVAGGSPNWAISAVSHSIPTGSFGSNRVTLTAAAPLPDLTSGVFTQAGVVKGAGSSAFTPGATWSLGADSTTLTKPRIVATAAVDRDMNGCLDGVRLTFNENVGAPTAGDWTVTRMDTTPITNVVPTVVDTVPNDKSFILAFAESPCRNTAGNPASGQGTLPRVSSVSAPSLADLAGNSLRFGPIQSRSVGDANAAAAGATTITSASNGFRESDVGRTVTSASGLAANTRIHSVAAGGGSATISPPTTDAVSGVTVHLNPRLYREPATDGAPPVVTRAATADCRVWQPTGPALLVTTGCDPNGKIDGIALTFSEPIPDASVAAGGWLLRLTDLACLTTTPSGMTAPFTYTITGSAALGTAGSATKVLRLAEIGGTSTYDTGCRSGLELSYFGSPAVTDAAGNAWHGRFGGTILTGTGPSSGQVTLNIRAPPSSQITVEGIEQPSHDFSTASLGVANNQPFRILTGPAVGTYTVASFTPTSLTFAGTNPPTSGTFVFPRPVTVRDGAGPFLATLQGTVGSTTATATFSEAVCGWRVLGGDGCAPLQVQDFVYRRASGADATSLAGVSASGNVATLTLPAPLASGDMGTATTSFCLELVAPATPGTAGNAASAGVTDVAFTPVTAWPTVSGLNLPAPSAASPVGTTSPGNACKGWVNSAAPRILAGGLVTVDSNEDGYLDALRVTLDRPIVPGTRLLRHDGSCPSGTPSAAPDGAVGCGDAIYYDAQAPGTTGFGTVSTGDFRFTAYAGTAAGTVACPADPDCDSSIAHTDPNKRLSKTFSQFGAAPASDGPDVLWVDVGADGAGTGDGAWADNDGSGTVTQGDFRYLTLGPSGGYAASSTVSCSVPRDVDCGAAIGSTQTPCPGTGPACYGDADGNGLVSQGDRRLRAVPQVPANAAVNCIAATPDPDCGRVVTPTSVQLDATDFRVTFGTTDVLVTCVLAGKSAGSILSSTSGSSCNGGSVVGNAAPPPGAVPSIADSCVGALQHTLNNSVFYVCFVPWLSPTGVPIPNTGQTPKLSHGPCLPNPPGSCTRVRGLDGTPMGGFSGADAKTASDGASPVLVDVLASAGDNRATLVFSEGVKSTAGAIRTVDLAYINGNAGTANCRSGVSSITTVPASTATPGAGVFLLNVTLSGRLTHDDVVGCIQQELPASPFPARDGIRPAPSLVETATGARPAVAKTVLFRDLTGPRLERAEFIDAEGVTAGGLIVPADGTIDAVRLVFSEPVNDCFGAVAAPPDANADGLADFPGWTTACDPAKARPAYGWPAGAGPFEVKVGTRVLTIKSIVTGQIANPTPDARTCRAHYNTDAKPAGMSDADWTVPLLLHAGDTAPTHGPADGFNDNTIFLCLVPDTVPNSVTPGTRGLATDLVGTVKYTAPSGACSDPTPPPQLVCDLANVGPYRPGSSPLAARGNGAPSFEGPIRDAARPLVLNVTTDDVDHNGKIDSIRVLFTEPLNATLIATSDWSIEGRAITGFALPSNPATCSTTAPTASTGADRIWLCFAEKPGAAPSDYDTGEGHSPGTGPRVSYAAGGGLRDRANPSNALRGMVARATDGAPPVVIRLQAQDGSATATITFSEGVEGTGNPGTPTLSITYNDLYYEEQANSLSSATGFGSNQVVHSPGDIAAVVTLNAAASSYDIANDRICFVAGAIREQGGGLALYDTCFGLNGLAGDRVPPPPVTGLRIHPDLPEVTLEWDTPNSTDVVSIAVYVCTTQGTPPCQITVESIRGTAPGVGSPVVAEGTPRPAARGTKETYRYTLPVTSPLLFGVATLDAAGNIGTPAVLPPLEPRDTRPPEPVTGITVNPESRTGDRVTLSFRAPREDAGVTTSGKVARYHIFKVEGTAITAADLTLANQVSPANLVPDVSGSGAASAVSSPGTTQQVTVTGLSEGVTYTFAVRPIDEAGNFPDFVSSSTATATPQRSEPPTTTTPTTAPPTGFSVADRNADIMDSLTVADNPDGEGNLLTWTMPPEDASKPTQGLQVWKCPGGEVSACELLATLPATDTQYVDADGTPQDAYLVTAYYGNTPADGRADDAAGAQLIPGFTSLTPKSITTETGGLFGIPLWAWIVAGAVLLLLAIALVWAATRRRQGTIEPGEPGDSGEPAQPAAEADAAAAETWAAPGATPAAGEAAAPVAEPHHITCPKCSTEFQVTGVKPLAIQCPNCGVRGVLR